MRFSHIYIFGQRPKKNFHYCSEITTFFLQNPKSPYLDPQENRSLHILLPNYIGNCQFLEENLVIKYFLNDRKSKLKEYFLQHFASPAFVNCYSFGGGTCSLLKVPDVVNTLTAKDFLTHKKENKPNTVLFKYT